MLCENFVKFGPVTPELTGFICERQIDVVKKLAFFMEYLWIYCTDFRILYAV